MAYAGASSSMASSATASLLPRIPASCKSSIRCLSLPHLPQPRVSTSSFSVDSTNFSESSRRFSSLQIIKASSTDETSIDANELLNDLKEKWDAVEDKSTVLLYGGGAILAVWVSSIVVGAINSVPLLPKVMELVGLGYTGWFVYRYLLFKTSRKELAQDIESLKKKIAGTE
ncbi:Protein CURVATURE THYLAKOID 1A, chloroplastic [Dionaea muscipula]